MRCPVASTEAAKPLGRDEGAKNARAGDPPLGLRPLEAERPVVGKLRHEADRRSDGDVAGRPAPEPRARPARAVRERRGRDLPRPRAALGQGHDFAYPMYPSRHFRFVREYHHIIFLIQYFGIRCRVLADGRSGCVYRTDRNGPIASVGPRTDPTGPGRTPPEAGAGERARPGRLLAGKPSPRCMRRSANRIARTIWTLLAHERACRDDCASSPAGRTVGREGEMARREVANGTTRGDGKQVGPACHEAFGGAGRLRPALLRLPARLGAQRQRVRGGFARPLGFAACLKAHRGALRGVPANPGA